MRAITRDYVFTKPKKTTNRKIDSAAWASASRTAERHGLLAAVAKAGRPSTTPDAFPW